MLLNIAPMKRAALVLALIVMPMLAQAGDFEITVQRKKAGESGAKVDVVQKTSQGWIGNVKIENRGFKPAQELVARYILFVKRQHAGQKQGEDQIEKVKGDYKVAELKPGANITFPTQEVKLNHSQLDGNYYYIGGGMTKTDDGIAGVWVKLFKGETLVGEYINPPNATAKFKWE